MSARLSPSAEPPGAMNRYDQKGRLDVQRSRRAEEMGFMPSQFNGSNFALGWYSEKQKRGLPPGPRGKLQSQQSATRKGAYDGYAKTARSGETQYPQSAACTSHQPHQNPSVEIAAQPFDARAAPATFPLFPRTRDRPCANGIAAELPGRPRCCPLPKGRRYRSRGQRASTVVVSPPRGVKSPRTAHHSGFAASAISRRMRFTAFS